jgi:hypothetical protein
MRKTFLVLVILAFLQLGGKDSPKEFKCDKVHTIRMGCICKDGTKSTAIGRGACSKHKGVNYWLCK